jgi:hypothetical protein
MSGFINKLRRRHSHEYAPYQHLEQHFESAEIVRDAIIGLSGLYKIRSYFVLDIDTEKEL